MTRHKISRITKYDWQKRRLLLVLCALTLCLQLSTFNSFAQYTKLLDFGSKTNGYLPYSSLISDGTFLYGMTSEGGTNDLGTIYKIKPDGTGFVKLLDFDGTNGSNPKGSLLLIGTTLYGMTVAGGANGQGVIFTINSNGTGFTNLFDFDYTTSGAFPHGSLIFDGTFLYGMTYQGGSASYGTVFKIMPDGTGFSKLLDFNGSTGGYSYGSLILEGGSLHGMTSQGGSNGLGTIFKVNTDGTGFLKLLDFTGTANGATPWGSLISDGVFLYGMTLRGGANDFGAIFKIKSDATGFTKLLDFDNSIKGAYPKGSLAFSPDLAFVYGTTTDYGLNGYGTIFKVKTDGTGFIKLLDNDVSTFNPNPEGSLLVIGTTIYGAKSGITNSYYGFLPGTLFAINDDGTGYSKLFYFDSEGSNPSGSLFSDGTFQYGATYAGGLRNYGTLFKIKPNGTGYVRLFDFTGSLNGSRPTGTLISDGTFLYGMTSQGGVNDYGTIYKIKPDGSGYVKLLDFDYTNNGNSPYGSLFYDGTFLYGMTSGGGVNSYGTLFKIKPDGAGYTKLLDFDYVNSGAYPHGSLISDGTFLYGTTNQGNSNGWGTVFKVEMDGTGFVNLLDFDNTTNGSNPKGDLYYDGTFLYGMTSNGPSGNGAIFKIKSDGTGYTKLMDFAGGGSEGSFISDGTFLYGMATGTGLLGLGTIFRIKPDGTGFASISEFNDGKNPSGSLISDGAFLYGMTPGGGANNAGVLFKSSMTLYTSITDFQPADGVVGTLVTINGNNFDPTPANNVVKFNGTIATVTSATTTALTAFVPVGTTDGPISVTANGTDITLTDFNVATEVVMVNGTVKNCNIPFKPPTYTYIQANGYNDIIETFLPTNPSDKVKISFSTFNVSGGDVLYVYDGPTSASPLLATLSGLGVPADVVATRPGGELTFVYTWGDGTTNWNATISCQSFGITISNQPSDFVACVGNFATFNIAASGTTNISYQWQFASALAGPYSDIANGGGYTNVAGPTLSVNTTSNFGGGFYRCKVDGDFVPTVFTNAAQLTINPIPTAPGTTGASACPPAVLILNASGATDGQYKWYNVLTGGIAISGEVNSTYTTSALSVSTDYYVSITIGTCESSRTLVTAQINTVPLAPTTTAASGCTAAALTLNAAGGANGQYRWYTVPTAGTAIAGEMNSSYLTPVLSTSTTYYVSITNGTCESIRTSVAGQINTPPAAPTTTGNNSCGPAALVLTASGGTIGQYRWYVVASGGTAIAGEVNSSYTTPSLNATTTYFAAINDGTCESTRTSAVAQINIIPTPPTTAGTTGCNPSSVSLTASGGSNGQYRWYTVVSGGTPIAGEVNSSYTTPSLNTTTAFYVAINNSTCESTRTSVLATINTCVTNLPPAIKPPSIAVPIEGKVKLNLVSLLSDPDNNLDLSTLKIISQPESKAVASIDVNNDLIIDYNGNSFSGKDHLTIEVCDLAGSCTQKQLEVEVASDLNVYNGISPNGDDQNPIWIIEYIDILEDTKKNHVTLFNRWGDTVFEVDDYDNKTHVFSGINKNGNELPSGIYFYKIEFSGGRKQQTGYLTLKR